MKWTEDLIGRCSSPKTYHIDREMLKQFSQSLELTYPPYFDKEAAQSEGYRDIIAPPTFAFTLTAGEIPGFELPAAGIIHGEQQFEYALPLTAGDEIQVVACVDNLKKRGSTVFLTLKTVAHNLLGDMVFVSRSLFIITLKEPV
ncbi:FAS1-like dehydratase domain-containing protein [Sulfobacillus thermosulfidooxidans]|uniref:FAS1-like dehydratase domain-containing protein n=1 Tax=Sulfobacillus thermosulfidooxidans TaxID=28034 RepID=UPI0006B4E365|nr:MaoC family dehydratase N-terminal domain-containing protein [Sulfobacillus thermosulfidooxidans]